MEGMLKRYISLSQLAEFFQSRFPGNRNKIMAHWSVVCMSMLVILTTAPCLADSGKEVMRYGVKEYVKMVLERNESVMVQHLEWKISQESIRNAQAIFEPDFIAGYHYQKTEEEYTEEEKAYYNFFMSSFKDRDERYNTYKASVKGLVPTGATLEIGYSLDDISNQFNTETGDEYVTTLNAKVTQPLLKGRGTVATKANIHVAEADAQIEHQTYRLRLMQTIFESARAYWDLKLAQKMRRLRSDSVRNAERLLANNTERVKAGMMAETELLEAETGLYRRRTLQSDSHQKYIQALNRVMTLASLSGSENQVFEAVESLEMQDLFMDLDECLQKAFAARPEYLSAKRKVSREKIRLAHAKNQRFPQLDMFGSYGINGKADSTGDSWSEAFNTDYVSWAVGVELEIPLGGGIDTRSEVVAAKYRCRQAEMDLRSTEVRIANDIESTVRIIDQAAEQVCNSRRTVELNERMLDVELARFSAGRSNSWEMLKRENLLNQAKIAQLESLVRYKRAVLACLMAQGKLLDTYDVKVEEVRH